MRRILAISSLALALIACLGVPASSSAAASSAAATLPTASELDAYLGAKGSPMAGQGSAFLASGGRWQVDPRLLIAIAGAESNFGSITCAPFNAWGYGCPNGPFVFTSWADGIDTVAKGLRENYLAEGRISVALINLKYAPIGAANDPTGLNNHWTVNVSNFLIELGGDPSNIDISGVAGTRLLGMIAADQAGYGFQEEDTPAAADATAALEVAPGMPQPLAISVRNTGSKAWDASNVRLRRVDLESRIVGDPYGSIVATGDVASGKSAKFVVLLAAVGSQAGSAQTRWRLEGPSGPFGPEIVRSVGFTIPQFVVADWRVGSTSADGVQTVQLRVRNAGSGTWKRDGADGVRLGVVSSSGALRPIDWPATGTPSVLLERETAPGEDATFVFRIAGEGTLELQPFATSTWATGRSITLDVSPSGVVVGTSSAAAENGAAAAAGA